MFFSPFNLLCCNKYVVEEFPDFFQTPLGTNIPCPPQLIMDLLAGNQKRYSVEDKDVRIAGPPTLKKKRTGFIVAKKPKKKNVKVEDEKNLPQRIGRTVM